MAQSEDTELRDLVIEALEKNGSLAKIRALLRANVFLAFEDECEKKHNPCLDNILKLPEGIISLSIVHEFLEFCNLKNTLFVYMSETRQGKEYTYEGKKNLEDKLNCNKREHIKEPLLVSIVKGLLKRKFYEQNDNATINKDEPNCTYIVHEDTSSTSSQSNSQSDQSSDEKNKLLLRLPLDNSDTDTSTDSARDKTSSEYIPNEHIVIKDESDDDNNSNTSQHSGKISQHSGNNDTKNAPKSFEEVLPTTGKDITCVTNLYNFQLNDLVGNNSSESTSYLDFKPFNSLAEKMLNTTGLPTNESLQNKELADEVIFSNKDVQNALKVEPESPATLSNVTTISSKIIQKKSQDEATRTQSNTPEYSYDFSISSPSKNKEKQVEQQTQSLDSVQNYLSSDSKNMTVESPQQNSQSSQSSVSISDVADLIELSEANSPRFQNKDNEGQNSSNLLHNSKSNSKSNEDNVSKVHSDDSGDFSESPIPSLSNISLDFTND